MRLSLLHALLLTSCVTSPKPPHPMAEMSKMTTVCAIMFPDRKGIKQAESCPAGTERVAIGFAVAPIDGECEGAFLSLHGFRQIWGCQ